MKGMTGVSLEQGLGLTRTYPEGARAVARPGDVRGSPPDYIIIYKINPSPTGIRLDCPGP